MNKRKPDFLLIGNVKSASTSLLKYLSYHPNIFIPEYEPRYISSHFISYPQGGPKDTELEDWIIKNEESYLGLFANKEEDCLGENSSDIFYYLKQSIPIIKSKIGDPKIILLLRNPVLRMFSSYNHLVRDEREDLSMDEALEKEHERILENWELLYYYRDASLYCDKVKLLLESFSNVKIVITEELFADRKTQMNDIYEFLDLEYFDDGLDDVYFNKSGKPRSNFLRRIIMDENSLIRKVIRPVVRLFLDKKRREKVFTSVLNVNLKTDKFSKEIYNTLRLEFDDDIQALSKLLSKDLSDLWPFEIEAD